VLACVRTDLNTSVWTSASKSPVDPAEVVRILSDGASDCVHARIKIAIPAIPKNTLRNTASDLSPDTYRLHFITFTNNNEGNASKLAVIHNFGEN